MYIDCKNPPVFRRLCLGVQPALGRDEDPGAAESDDRAQGQPGEWSGQVWHDRGRCGDQTSKCDVGADVPDPFDDSAATCCAQCEADEVAAEYRPAIVASKSSIATRKEKKVTEESVGELDRARCNASAATAIRHART